MTCGDINPMIKLINRPKLHSCTVEEALPTQQA
jgi:hypothetical protein